MNTMIQFLFANWQDFLLGGFMVACMVVVFMGILKKAKVFSWISNKSLKGTIMAFSSVILVLPFTALMLIGNSYAWQFYWLICLFNSAATVIVYWLYEHTRLRNLVSFIGNKGLGMFFAVLRVAVEQSQAEANKKLIGVPTAAKSVVRTALQDELKANQPVDEQLKGL